MFIKLHLINNINVYQITSDSQKHFKNKELQHVTH